MHQETIKAIVLEISPLLTGRFLGKVFQLAPFTLIFDFRLRHGDYLLISVEPKSPRLHLITRRVRELEKQSGPPGPFAQSLRSVLGTAELQSVSSHPTERIVSFVFITTDELGSRNKITLLAQLTGRSANLFLLDSENVITHALRPPRGEGQQLGERYNPPPSQAKQVSEEIVAPNQFPSLSAAVDDHFRRRESAENFAARVQSVREKLRRQLTQKEKLRKNLMKDLSDHGDPEQHKRWGDLLLANIATAERLGDRVRLKDYYAEGAPEIELQVDENLSLQDQAANYFSRYAKSKRAKDEISRRLAQLESDLHRLHERQAILEEAVSSRDEGRLAELEETRQPLATGRTKKGRSEKIPGVRRYRSSDGYEILVGRAAHTNDRLTFKVAKPQDIWLHAADYPGSHVVVRNASRREVPQRTIFEAAALAAKFSQAGGDSKVDVHYTERKFLSKPKGAAPGLVRMSSFRTVTVKPDEGLERI